MKNYILTLLISLSFISCKKEGKNIIESTINKDSEWREFGLNGKVKSIAEYTTQKITDGQSSKTVRKFENQSLPDISLKFNEFGKLINKKVYSENGTVAEDIDFEGKDKTILSKKFVSPTQFSSLKYTWNGDKNTILTRRNFDGSLLDKEVYQYDKDLKVNRLKFNANDIQVDRIAYSYDSENRLIEEKYFRDKPTIQSSITFEYDTNGNKSVEASYDKDYKLIWKTTFEYNAKNLLLSSKTFNKEGGLENEYYRNYDNQYRLISKGTYETFDNAKNKEVFEYDENNNTTSWKVYKNEKIVSETVYKYDFKNNLIYQTITDSNNQEVFKKEVEYTYDNDSNWTNKITKINNNLVLLTSRKIEYYK